MNSNQKQGFFDNLKYDLPASIVVFLVALPLCLGIALASGAPLFSGIIAGIVGGIVVSLFSGSALGVSGPAAGLAVIVLTSIQDLGSFQTFLLAVVIAGALQLAFGLLKAGVIGYYFPASVIKGMLSGIGVIITLKQIPHAFGYDNDPEGDFAFAQTDGHNTFSELWYMLDGITPGAIIITVVSMAILILWERPWVKNHVILGKVQGPLLVVVFGILFYSFLGASGTYALKSDQLVSIPVAGSLGGFFQQFSFPDFTQFGNGQVYLIAFTIAVVASLESLLCVEAADKLDPQKRVTPTNRELVAQGIGNMVSGFIGGLPVTQVIVRSSANIQSGGKTKASAFFHGILLLISAMAIPKVLNMIPLSSLAAILLVVGYKLAKPALFIDMYKKGMGQFIPFVVTILGIVFTDLLTGIGLGLVIAIFQILHNNYKTPYHVDADDYKEGEPVYIKLSEDVSFLNKASILTSLDNIPDHAELVIDASETRSIHPDVVEIIEDFMETVESRNIKFELKRSTKKLKNPIKEFDQVILQGVGAKVKK
jgi:MFS superfamily sulfate permease-like transporter